MKKKLIIFGSIAVIMAIFVVVAVKNKPDTVETIGGDKSGKRVQVEYIKQDNIEAKISSSGKLEAIDTKTIYLDTSNKIVTLNKERGDAVQKGEVILILDKEVKQSNERNLALLETQLAAAQETLNDLLKAGSKGDVLKAQQAIASLEDSKKKTQQDIEDAKVKITSLKNKLSDAEKELKLNEELLEQGLVSQKEVDNAKDTVTDTNDQINQTEATITLSEESLKTTDLNIQSAQYTLDVLLNKEEDPTKTQSIIAQKAQIKQYEKNIEDTKVALNQSSTQVVAPISGIITDLPVEEGMSVAAGASIVTIVDPSSLKVTCAISPYYAADLRLGLDAEVKYTGSKTVEVKGKVTKVSAVATVEKTTSGETTSIPVEVQVDEPGDIIKPGFSVNVKLITDTRSNVCLVPILAVEEDDDLSYVYIVGEDGTIEKREIEQGLSNGLYVEANNVKAGEMIVSSLEDFLKDGMKVSYEKIGEEQ